MERRTLLWLTLLPATFPLIATATREPATEAQAAIKEWLKKLDDAEFVVAQVNTTFENKAHAVESVTATLDRDGHWRIAGYVIK